MDELFDRFIKAIHEKHKVKLTFYSNDDKGFVTRICAPMDHAPSRRERSGEFKLHFWDYTSLQGPHPLSLSRNAIQTMEVLAEHFEPDVVTWDVRTSPWNIKRDWGSKS